MYTDVSKMYHKCMKEILQDLFISAPLRRDNVVNMEAIIGVLFEM